MEDLIARLEAATAPDRELDDAIRIFVDHNEMVVLDLMPGYVPTSTLPYTGSLDAAMTLVPEGNDVQVNFYFGRTGEGAAVVSRLKQINLPRTFAPTAPLALCIAALKARAPTTLRGGEIS